MYRTSDLKAPSTSAGRDSPPIGHPAAYLGATLAGALLSVAGILGLFFLLQAVSRLPPPPIANNLCIDEKLAFMRDQPLDSPNVLVLGSSVAWRTVDGGAMAAAAPGVRPLNGAFCGLRMSQTEFVGGWLLDRLPSVRAVVLVASPFDFIGCRVNPTAVFNREAADDFVYGRESRWTFYFRYFDPVSMLRNVRHIAALRSNADPLNSIVFTRFGDGPMDTGDSLPTLIYGAISSFDESCFSALGKLAHRLHSEGRRLAVVTTPMNPLWKERFDHGGTVRAQFVKEIAAAVSKTGAKYWDGDAAMPMERDAFTDAIHLRWSAAGRFSETVARELGGYLLPVRVSNDSTTTGSGSSVPSTMSERLLPSCLDATLRADNVDNGSRDRRPANDEQAKDLVLERRAAGGCLPKKPGLN